jgi:hypothetical protein
MLRTRHSRNPVGPRYLVVGADQTRCAASWVLMFHILHRFLTLLAVSDWRLWLCVEAAIDGLGRMVMASEKVGDRLLGEAKSIVHSQPVRRGALGIAELDLRSNTRQQPSQTLDEVGARFDDSFAL